MQDTKQNRKTVNTGKHDPWQTFSWSW